MCYALDLENISDETLDAANIADAVALKKL
jgi:hypothetical protein